MSIREMIEGAGFPICCVVLCCFRDSAAAAAAAAVEMTVWALASKEVGKNAADNATPANGPQAPQLQAFNVAIYEYVSLSLCDLSLSLSPLLVQQNDYDHDPYAKEFGINISSKLASIEVQSLSILYIIYSIQLLTYSDTGKEKEYLLQVGQRNMMIKVSLYKRVTRNGIVIYQLHKVINGGMVRYWACINFSRSVQESTARGFCQELVQTCQISGMEFDPDPVIPIYSARPDQENNWSYSLPFFLTTMVPYMGINNLSIKFCTPFSSFSSLLHSLGLN
ncbi:hypothetical protein GQ457_HM000950 [Hibiscus cannabinus]